MRCPLHTCFNRATEVLKPSTSLSTSKLGPMSMLTCAWSWLLKVLALSPPLQVPPACLNCTLALFD